MKITKDIRFENLNINYGDEFLLSEFYLIKLAEVLYQIMEEKENSEQDDN